MPEPARLVVADTSPLLYLHQAQQLHLLRALYGAVVVPPAVPGESEVIALGLANPGSLALLDDRLARRIAAVSGLAHAGTLGILLKAKSVGLLDAVKPVLENLRSRGMRIHDNLELRILRMAGESGD